VVRRQAEAGPRARGRAPGPFRRHRLPSSVVRA
jgi:hypothetical protein